MDDQKNVVGSSILWNIYSQRFSFINICDESKDGNKYYLNFKEQTYRGEDMLTHAHVFWTGNFYTTTYENKLWKNLTTEGATSHIFYSSTKRENVRSVVSKNDLMLQSK